MATGTDLGDDDGFLSLTAAGTTVSVDVWQTRSRIRELIREHGDGPDGPFFAAAVRMMQEMGYPPVSHRMADLWIGAVMARFDELKKKPCSGAGSPGSTPGPTSPA